MKKAFRASIKKALNDPNLGGALGKFSEAYQTNRARAYQGVDFEALRSRIAGVKSAAAGHLDELADTFRANAEALGAKVFRSRDPHEVKEYILKVARENGVRTVVKSKSMATEEIHLNGYLAENGISVAETDLGEWIIQLAGQTPSHMVMPAIHMTREEVAELFSKEVDERLSGDIPRLVQVARDELRPRFLAADLGITGANIAVAETGSIVLATNEGNARLVTTLPKIHIALVGVEKLVEKFEEALPILEALPRSATGQLLTSYLSIISGPTQNDDGTPKELHIILMDNRRSEMASDPKFKQALQCIRCGSCLNVCPIFKLVGGHVFGGIYTGGIGTILTAWFEELQKSEEIQGLCMQCGSCTELCPGKLDIPEMIREIRHRLVLEKGQPLAQKAIFGVVNNRALFHSMLRAASIAAKPLASGGFIRHLPLFLSDLTEGRSLPAIAAEPFRDLFPKLVQPRSKEKVLFYAGCLIDFAYPETGVALVRLLNKAGIEVVFPEGQTCCGAPALYSGAYEVAAQNAVDNIEALLGQEAECVVSACPTCTVALLHEFTRTLEEVGRSEWADRARELAGKSVDLSTLVKRLVDQGRLSFKEGKELGEVTYHDACHLKRTMKVFREPRELLQKAGYRIAEMHDCDACCGMGGSYSMKLPEISGPILRKKLQSVKESGAPVVAMDCPGCVLQIRGGFDQEGSPVLVKHTAELLAEQLEE